MPKKRKNTTTTDDVTSTKLPEIPHALLDELIASAGGPGRVKGPDGLLKQLTAALVSRALQAEMTEHLGYDHGNEPPDDQANRRNGRREKTVRTERGDVDIAVPRDRDGTFEPKLVGKHERHFDGFDDKIIAMYARGMSTRDIQRLFHEIYGVEVSPDLVSRVTEAVVAELQEWQGRTLERVYPIVYLDALVVKIRDTGVVENKSIYIAVGVDLDGGKDVLGMWVERTEGAKFWLSILTELKTRGVEDILILCADGLTGLPKAVEAAFPRTIFQTCVVHMIRSSIRYVPYKDLKPVCKDLRRLYTASSIDDAKGALEAFDKVWGRKYPHAVRAWRDRLDEWTPFLAYPPEIRRAIYTTNSIEALNRILRKVLKTRGPLPTDEAALKLIYLAIRNAKATWGKQQHAWRVVRNQLNIHFDGRISDGD